jgi:hypothetical protein
MKWIRALVKAVLATFAGPDQHSRGRETVYIGGVNLRYPDDPPIPSEGITRSVEPPSYGRPQHIPEAVKARQIAEWKDIGTIESVEEVAR